MSFCLAVFVSFCLYVLLFLYFSVFMSGCLGLSVFVSFCLPACRSLCLSVLSTPLFLYIVELRTPATPVGDGGGKERGGCHLNLRT